MISLAPALIALLVEWACGWPIAAALASAEAATVAYFSVRA